jgi:hypothetical protein
MRSNPGIEFLGISELLYKIPFIDLFINLKPELYEAQTNYPYHYPVYFN